MNNLNHDKNYWHGSPSGTVDLGDISVRYKVEGQGIPCLVIGSSVYYPRTIPDELKKHIMFIYVDLRHFSPTSIKQNIDKISLDSYLDDIETIRRKLNIEQNIIMGHSVHGTLALEYSRKYPDNVSCVIAISALPNEIGHLSFEADEFWDEDASETRKLCLERNWEAFDFDTLNSLSQNEAVINAYIRDGPKYWFDPEYDSSRLWTDVKFNTEVNSHLWDNVLYEYDIAQNDKPISCPVFLALGRFDYIVPYSCWDDKKNIFDNLTYHLFEKSSHTPHFEESDNFSQKLLEWYQRISI